MKSRSLLPALAALAVTIPACQGGAGPLSDEDLAAIGGVRDAFVQGVLAGNWSAVAALHTEGSLRMPPNEPVVQGRAAIEAHLAAPGIPIEFTATSLETVGHGGMAYDRGTFALTLAAEGEAEPTSDAGKYVVLLEKQADGSWLITHGIWSSDLPLPE